jgi:phage-related protein
VSEGIIRKIFYYENYYLDFFGSLKPEVKKKFNWTLLLIATVDKIPEKCFKHMTGTTGIYEIRVEVGSDIYRVFSFFNKDQLVILVNGFQKKSQKTPKKEIELAEKLRKEYFNEKERK